MKTGRQQALIDGVSARLTAQGTSETMLCFQETGHWYGDGNLLKRLGGEEHLAE